MLDHTLAMLVMNALPGIGPGRKRILAELFGSVEAALEVPREELTRVPGFGTRLADVIVHWREHVDPEQEISLARRAGAYIMTDEDEDYPPLLKEIHDPPICLYVLGNREALKNSQHAIAMVGSRYTTPYGMRMADKIATEATYGGWTIVSGLARGIDTASHQACLNAGGCTVAVVGSGLTCLYPQENIPMAERIVATGGAVISEFPMRYRPDKRTFPMRNRIISGMSQGTIVVQAGVQSGSLITATLALEQGRTVFAVPGPADIVQSHGCHALIRDGARIIESFSDVLDEYSQFPALRRKRQHNDEGANPAEVTSVVGTLTPLEEKIVTQLKAEGELYVDDLIDTMEDDPSAIMSSVLTLELKHVISQLPGKRIVLK